MEEGLAAVVAAQVVKEVREDLVDSVEVALLGFIDSIQTQVSLFRTSL